MSSNEQDPSTKNAEETNRRSSPDESRSRSNSLTDSSNHSGSDHQYTGAEKFATFGGSGGAPVQTGQGYEGLAHH